MRNALSIVRAARVAGVETALGLRAVALALLVIAGSFFGPATANAADCKPPSYCRDRGACVTIAEVTQDANRRYNREGFAVASVRLRGHAPTDTCLWYEVSLRNGAGASHVAYWNVTGGQVR